MNSTAIANNIALIGFSGTGKSSVARKVAELLDWKCVDTDDEVVRLAGKSIAEIFARDGEGEFRRLEREVLERACGRAGNKVIATGGGIVIDARNRELLREHSVVVCLEASPEVIHERLLAQGLESSSPAVRPLLAGGNALEKIKELKKVREPLYAAVADRTVVTDRLGTNDVSLEVINAWQSVLRSRGLPGLVDGGELACVVATATARYPIFVGWGVLRDLGRRMKQLGLSGNAVIIGDDSVFAIYGAKVRRSLEEAGFGVKCYTVPPGEVTKSIEEAVRVYDFLVRERVERKDVIIALGGGVVGDLAGFVAATYMRGLSWVQVPTTLMAMVDASIGGKVAVNHPSGKNLIGAFHQPSLVLADLETLTTLPKRELVSGWAEVIKHGMIADVRLLELLEDKADALLAMEPSALHKAVAWSASIKAQVVSEDEKEMGKRTILNYGHTVGHALEAATGYERFFHGEAVSIGMMADAEISVRLGLLSRRVLERQKLLLERFGLPTECSGVDVSDIIRTMELDKKVRNKAIRWVLLENVGKTVVRSDVPEDVVLSALAEVIRN